MNYNGTIEVNGHRNVSLIMEPEFANTGCWKHLDTLTEIRDRWKGVVLCDEMKPLRVYFCVYFYE